MAGAKKGRRALGRGLEALLPSSPKPASAPRGPRGPRDGVMVCPIERIKPRRDQPRRRFDKEALEELAQTIREYGVLQPIVVRRNSDDSFEIIAGERRWRAAQKAGKKQVPVVVKDVSPDTAYELALIENLQRQDLNPIEVAEGFERLLNHHGYTQAELAGRMGKSRVALTNALRLLKLPEQVRGWVRDGVLSEGHGRALLGAPDAATILSIARKATRGLSVRKTEQLVKQSKASPAADGGKAAPAGKSAAVRDLEGRLSRRLAARVNVEHKGPGGMLTIRYQNLDELDAIIERLDA